MVHLTRLGGTIQDLNRLREILQVFVKHGFEFLVDRLHFSRYLPHRQRAPLRREHRISMPERARKMCEELGPTFIKLGQALSLRPDLLPPAYVRELSKLQDRVPPVGREEVERVLTEELGQKPGSFFRAFDPEPIAAASIAQVHRATLKNGRQVAVKVQRPGLRKIIEADLEILRVIARAWEKLSGEDLPRHPVEFIDEFDALLQAELDFLNEARHLERFRRHFARRPEFYFPVVFLEQSTSRCLIQEYIRGQKLAAYTRTRATPVKQKLARQLLRGYVLMALEDRFFHADPHPGNLLVDSRQRIVFLDAGQVGRLDQETVVAFSDMLLGLIHQDTEALVDAYLGLGTTEAELDHRELLRDVTVFFEPLYDLPVDKISFGESLQELIALSSKHRIRLPKDFVVLAKTFLGAEALARDLDPKLNLVSAARPLAEQILRQRYAPRRVAQTLARQFKKLERFLLGLPAQLQDLLRKLQTGKLKIEFQHQGLEGLRLSLDRASNRLSFALIVAALIVGSSLLLFSRLKPLWGDISVIGLVGFVLAGIFGLWLIVQILRSGRLR